MSELHLVFFLGLSLLLIMCIHSWTFFIVGGGGGEKGSFFFLGVGVFFFLGCFFW